MSCLIDENALGVPEMQATMQAPADGEKRATGEKSQTAGASILLLPRPQPCAATKEKFRATHAPEIVQNFMGRSFSPTWPGEVIPEATAERAAQPCILRLKKEGALICQISIANSATTMPGKRTEVTESPFPFPT